MVIPFLSGLPVEENYMPSFRSARTQAEHAISCKLALGQGRHDSQDDGRIHSVGTARNYEQALRGFAEYIQANHLGDLKQVGRLSERSGLFHWLVFFLA